MLRIILTNWPAWLFLLLLPTASARSLVFLDVSYYGCVDFIVVLTMADKKAYRFSHRESNSFAKFYIKDIRQLKQIALIVNEWETRRYDMETLGPYWDPWWRRYEIELRKDYEVGYESSWFWPRAPKRRAVYRDSASSSEDSVDEESAVGEQAKDKQVGEPTVGAKNSDARNGDPKGSVAKDDAPKRNKSRGPSVALKRGKGRPHRGLWHRHRRHH